MRKSTKAYYASMVFAFLALLCAIPVINEIGDTLIAWERAMLACCSCSGAFLIVGKVFYTRETRPWRGG